jgi:hypothetical protein
MDLPFPIFGIIINLFCNWMDTEISIETSRMAVVCAQLGLFADTRNGILQSSFGNHQS